MRRPGYVGVGSNIEPATHIPAALALLRRQMTVTGVSTFYRTAPLERIEQPPFANGVFAITTELLPRQVKQLLCAIEVKLGRRRTGDRHASRTLDLDLLTLGELVVRSVRFRLPDPDICARAFIAVPLLELAPELCLPDTGERLSALSAGLSSSGLAPDEGLTETLRLQLSEP